MSREIDAVDVISRIAGTWPHVDAVRLVTIPPAPRVQRRVADLDAAAPLMERALRLRADEGMRFWDALLLSASLADGGLSQDVARAALYHQVVPMNDDHQLVATGPGFDRRVRDRLASAPADQIVAMVSQVAVRGGTDVAHVPMLDFSARSDEPWSRPSVDTIVRALGVPGYLLESGRSYHFYGNECVDQAGLYAFMARALLFSPLVDGRWLAHQLMAGTCTLRISAGPNGKSPIVIHEYA